MSALKKPANKATRKPVTVITRKAAAEPRVGDIEAFPTSSAAVMAIGKDANGNVAHCPPPEEFDTSKPMLKHLGGSRSDHWNQMLCNQVISSGWFRENMPADEEGDRRTAILAFLAGVKPADVVEGMMAAQLYASHAAAMDCYRRAMIPGQTIEAKETLLTLSAKLTKANATQVEALKKYRGNGQQKVTVEHVHVYQGGQAIVGNVAPGGSDKILEVQPHAIRHAAGAPVRCENPQGRDLSVSGHAERTLPDARRTITGRA